jgi:hypothetical protein
MVRPSQVRRSVGGAQTGTHGTGHSNRLPVPGNQNTNTHGRDGNPNADSTSLENRGGNIGQGTPGGPASDVDQQSQERTRNRGNANSNAPEDPGNRKRKLQDDIVDAMSTGSLSKRINSGYLAFFFFNWTCLLTHHSSQPYIKLQDPYSVFACMWHPPLPWADSRYQVNIRQGILTGLWGCLRLRGSLRGLL